MSEFWLFVCLLLIVGAIVRWLFGDVLLVVILFICGWCFDCCLGCGVPSFLFCLCLFYSLNAFVCCLRWILLVGNCIVVIFVFELLLVFV